VTQTATEFTLAQIGQIAVTAQDLGRAVAFYRDTLGMHFLFQAPGLALHVDGDGDSLSRGV